MNTVKGTEGGGLEKSVFTFFRAYFFQLTSPKSITSFLDLKMLDLNFPLSYY